LQIDVIKAKRESTLIFAKTLILFYRIVCANVDQNLFADQQNFRANYLQNNEKTKLKSRFISF